MWHGHSFVNILFIKHLTFLNANSSIVSLVKKLCYMISLHNIASMKFGKLSSVCNINTCACI